MQKTLVALALIFATSFATLSDITLSASTSVGSASVGWTITGATTDKIGQIITDLGDFNGDGFNDYAVSGDASLNVYIILGQSTGRAATLDLTTTQATQFYKIALPAGAAVTALAGGDVNNDGAADLAIGSSSTDRVYVVYGKAATGTATWTTWADITITGDATIDANRGFTVKGAASSLAGISIAFGDFADDSKQDLIIGMPGWQTSTNAEGAVCVVYGRSNLATGVASTAVGRGTTNVDCATQTSLDAGTLFEGILITGKTPDKIGSVVAAGADMNGDGRKDVFVSSQTTKAFIVYGPAARASGTAVAAGVPIDLASVTVTWLPITLPTTDAITSASFIGAWNGGSRPNLALGYPSAGTGTYTANGVVYILFGQSTSLTTTPLVLSTTMTNTVGIAYTGPVDGGYFGYVVDGAGDVNGDGTVDLIVAAPLDSGSARTTGTKTGKVYIIYGGAGRTASVDLGTTPLTSATGITITGLAQTSFGLGVAGVNDVSADTVGDFVIGAPTGTKSGVAGTGVVYEFRGQKIDTAPKSGFRLHASLLVLASFFVALMF